MDNIPKRPQCCSALFTPLRSTSARSVFAALNNAAISASEINCLQHKNEWGMCHYFQNGGSEREICMLELDLHKQ